MIQYSHRYRGHRPNYINGDHWRNNYCSICQWGIALSGTSLLLFLATAITQKSSKIFTVKQEKHDVLKLLAQSKLDVIANIISQN